ncbi:MULTISPECIES: LicD family protein [Ruminococcus]|uniref:LicD family protein n=1 Tax=Ruminococcus TaxID=1263 RepID=UPI000E4378F9|nr:MULTISPECIES: LicD family protein [Ruminococcus]MBS6768283.1 LicD family protein [Clostridium sp.]RGM77614.1 LicD family protein [Ruminococcus sp. OM06-36AC]
MGMINQIKRLDAKKSGLHVVDDNELTKLKATLLDMLKDLIDVFDTNDIQWSLSGGSIIGAVRHHGFIPWDDDIDLFMTRKNFEKFKKIFNQQLGGKYRLRLPGDDGYILHFPTIEKLGTKIKPVQSAEGTQGLFIDIFILENAPDNAVLRMLHGLRSTAYLAIDSFVRTEACKKNLLKCGASSPELIKAVKLRCRLSKIFQFRKMEKWMFLSDKCFSSVKNDHSEYVVCPSGGAHYFGEIFKREYLEKTIKTDFEDIKANIPCNSDYYLTKRYGADYMTIPQDAAKERHTYIEFEL